MLIYFAGHPAGWESKLKNIEQEVFFRKEYALSRLNSYYYKKETQNSLEAIKLENPKGGENVSPYSGQY